MGNAKNQALCAAVVTFAESTARRVVSAMMSLVDAPQRHTKTRCTMFANLGWGSDRSNVVERPHASQVGFGVSVRMGSGH